jgi:capsular polysaccharide biosynthesis protein
MGESTYIGDLFKILKRFIWLIILLAVIGGIAGKVLAGNGPKPTYQTSALVLVKQQYDQRNTAINQADESARFMNTALTLANKPVILNIVKKELHLKENTKELERKVKVGIENGSHILRITVEDNNPSDATKLTNKVVEVFQKEIHNYIDVESVEVIEKAQSGQENQILQTRFNANIIMGVLIGLIIGVFLAFVLNAFVKKPRA